MTRLRILLFRLRALVRGRSMDRQIDDGSRAISPKRLRSTSSRVIPRRRRAGPRGVISVAWRRPRRRIGGSARSCGWRIWCATCAMRLARSARTRLHDGGGGHAGAGDWRQHRDVQRAERRAASAAALSGSRAAGDVVDRGSDARTFARADRPAGMSNSGGVRAGASRTWPSSIPSSATLTERRRGGTDRRRQDLAQPPRRHRRSARAGTQLLDRGGRAAAARWS